MTTNGYENNMVHIAVPYYGTLSPLPSRLTRIFFVVDVDVVKRKIVELSLEVWDPAKEASFPCWLKKVGAEGLICSDACNRQKSALNSEGIWVQALQEGEVHEVIERWMSSLPPRESKPPHKERPVSPALGTRRSVLPLAKRDGSRGIARTESAAKTTTSPQQRVAGRRSAPIIPMLEREYCIN